ncbi:DUF2336 domain-containing protein [Lutibaculum baratangense]|uniref:DUF2336 domain-containing protein n=1 Tax=Lutibaculum baratangense AMV1 TaxID=631454 RepID=V4R994_9HYPH|nr:DUF2336 domain-containing protein [Lutibaculum baratangense]ESR22771.1 hypothetical protein N177_3908 [Lutibaculum baratangense AMV1]
MDVASDEEMKRAFAEAQAKPPASTSARETLDMLVALVFTHARAPASPLPRHFTQLFLALLPRVGVADRAEIARRIAHSAALPREIVAWFAADVMEVAGTLLRQSPLLDEPTLLAVAEGGDVQRARCVAARSDLSPATRLALAGRGDPVIAEAMLSGQPGPIENDVAERLAETPELSPAATERLVTWSELGFTALARLFWSAEPQTRRILIERAGRRTAEAPPQSVAARKTDLELGSTLFAAAASRRPQDMARHLAAALRVPRTLAQRCLADPTGEAAVVICRAAGVGVSQLTSILVLMPTPEEGPVSGAHIRALVDLAERLSPEAALGLVRVWQGTTMASTAAHREPLGVAGHPPTARPGVRTGAQPAQGEVRDRARSRG